MANSAVTTLKDRVLEGVRTRHTFWIPVLLFAAFLPLRVPFRAKFLINWDAVNYALGTYLFNLQNHQPHPPGYIGYVATGWLLNHVTGDANTSLTLLSMISGAAAPAGFFLLASLFMPRAYALASALLFGLSPIVWYYSGVALGYSTELAFALFFLWAGYVGRRQHSAGHMLAATLLLVVLGAVRPSGALFLIPLWLYMVWGLPWRGRLSNAALLVVGNFAWLIPLFWLSGGIAAFMQASADLATLVVVPTSVFGANPVGPGQGQNIAFVALGLLIGVNLGLFLIAFGLLANFRAFGVFLRHGAFFFLWLMPAILTYLLLHTGQLGYVLIILPPFFLLAGVGLRGIAERWTKLAAHATAKARELLRARLAVATAIALLALVNVAAFLFVPRAVHAISQNVDAGDGENARLVIMRPLHRLAAKLEGGGIGGNARQFNVGRSDTHWRSLIDFVRQYEPEKTAVLTAPSAPGSFRHLTYYIPKYRVYGFGWDLQGGYGHLFTAHARTSDYTVEGLRQSGKQLQLPDEVSWLVVPDWEVQIRLDGLPTSEFELESGLKVLVVPVEPGALLAVEQVDDRWAVLRVNTPVDEE